MIIMVWWYSHLWALSEPHRKVWCAFFCLPLCRSQKAAKEFSFPLAFSRLSLCLLDWAAVHVKPEEHYSKIHTLERGIGKPSERMQEGSGKDRVKWNSIWISRVEIQNWKLQVYHNYKCISSVYSSNKTSAKLTWSVRPHVFCNKISYRKLRGKQKR